MDLENNVNKFLVCLAGRQIARQTAENIIEFIHTRRAVPTTNKFFFTYFPIMVFVWNIIE